MTYKCLSNGDGGGVASTKRKQADQEGAAPAESLGALKLDADEIASFEKWATGSNKPTEFMIEAAKAHKILRLKQK
jgi:hypothetical protein